MATRKQAARTLTNDAARALAADLGWHARLASRLITAELDRGLAAAGLSSTQFGLMCLIASAPDDTLGALAQRAGLNQSTMSRNVDMLVGAGLVEIAMVEKDRRRRAVWLTETGAMHLQGAIPLWRASHRALAARLGPKLARQFAEAAAAFGADGAA
jgi:DNA-binding MarR family transcriptional regulator